MKQGRAYFRLGISIALALLWMAFIFYMSAKVAADSDAISDGLIERALMALTGAVDPSQVRDLAFPVRKFAHFSEYTVLGILLMNAVCAFDVARGAGNVHAVSVLTRSQCLGAWAAGVLYAASDEVHQLFVPGRSGQVTDVCIDAAGVALGVLLFVLVVRMLARRGRR